MSTMCSPVENHLFYRGGDSSSDLHKVNIIIFPPAAGEYEE